jgi:membrane protein implicated in regulation of membrane protease activity
VIESALIWLGLAAVLLIIEALTAGLTTIWFAGGALVAAVTAYLGVGTGVQLLLFLCVSLLLLIFTRPLAMRFMDKGITKTNVNSLIGTRAVVTKEINNLAQTGQVRINDIEWTARSSSEKVIIPEKTIVEIEAVNGVKLIVHAYKEE